MPRFFCSSEATDTANETQMRQGVPCCPLQSREFPRPEDLRERTARLERPVSLTATPEGGGDLREEPAWCERVIMGRFISQLCRPRGLLGTQAALDRAGDPSRKSEGWVPSASRGSPKER